MVRTLFLATAAALVLTSAQASAQNARGNYNDPAALTPDATSAGAGQATSPEDKTFLNYVAQDNLSEIELCLLAEKQAGAPAVEAFSRLMVDDHTQVNSELGTLANSLGMNLTNSPSQEGQQTLSKLQGSKGPQFDQPFMQAQIKDHSDDIEKFNNEIHQTRNVAIRQFAMTTVATLNQHLELAKAVLRSMTNENPQSAQKQ